MPEQCVAYEAFHFYAHKNTHIYGNSQEYTHLWELTRIHTFLETHNNTHIHENSQECTHTENSQECTHFWKLTRIHTFLETHKNTHIQRTHKNTHIHENMWEFAIINIYLISLEIC